MSESSPLLMNPRYWFSIIMVIVILYAFIRWKIQDRKLNAESTN
jgi:hypothetical protein